MAETITDLTGYTWVGNDTLNKPDFLTDVSQTNISIEINNTSYTNLTIAYMYSYAYILKQQGYITDFTFNKGANGWAIICDVQNEYLGATTLYLSEDTDFSMTIGETTIPLAHDKGYTISNTMSFTGGTDATNTDLIAWLQENGTLTKDSSQQLEKPVITTQENTYSRFTLKVQNPSSNPSVSCYLTGGTTSIFDLESGASNTHTFLWGDAITTKTISFTFTADGYEDSENSITLIRPSYIAMNKYRSSNDFTPTMPTDELTQTLAFTSNNTSFSGMRITTDTLYYVKSDGTEVEVYNTSTKWTGNTEYIVILVSEGQSVSTIFKPFFDTLFKTLDNFTYTLYLNIGGIKRKVGNVS